jgi:hypothetical protein
VRPQTEQSDVALIGASLDLGAGRRGVDMGPSAIRYAQLNDRLAELGFDVVDAGPLINARWLEPLAMLWIKLSLAQGMRPIAFKLLRRSGQ